jgi:5'-3' exonuclease
MFLRVSILSQPTNSYVLIDEYLNESSTINTKRLQVILDDMGYGERELFAKEYADMNWYRGKQPKHVKEMEMGRKRSKLDIYLFGWWSAAPTFITDPPSTICQRRTE